jgi:hypothetical protein
MLTQNPKTTPSNIRLFVVAFFLTLTFASFNIVNAQNWTPYNYWTFDGTNALKDSMNQSNLDPAYYQSPYTILSNSSNVGVRKYLQLDANSKQIVASSQFVPDTAYTIEFLFKTSADINQTIQWFSRRDAAINLRLYFPYIRFTTKSIPAGSTATTTDNFDISMESIERGTYNYYVDGNWHHIVFIYDAKNGVKEVWIDGQLPTGFSKTLPGGLIPTNPGISNNNVCDVNTSTGYYKFYGGMDEIAVYKTALPANMIYKHYLDFTQNKPYTFANTVLAVPAATSITGSLNMNEFAPGHPNSNVDAVTQLKNFPAARALANTTLFPNTMIFNPAHIAGDGTSTYSQSTLVNRSKEVQKELVTNFQYALLVTSNAHEVSDFADTTKYSGAWIKMGNLNPNWKTSANSYWGQLNPQKINKASAKAYVSCGCLPSSSYLKNAGGQFIDKNGAVSTTTKTLSPESPLDSFKLDGQTMRYYLDQLTKNMSRPLNHLFENGETMPAWTSTGLKLDPIVNTAYTNSGLNDWSRFIGRGMKKLTASYTAEFLSLPALSSTRFSHFFLNGHPLYSWNWQETRELNSLTNGQRYSSGDIYMQRPNVWRYWQGAAHGWQFVAESRFTEISMGDKLYSPFVSPGWVNEELIPRPAQWLGFLKVISMSGAEYFQTGYFVTSQPYQNPNNYVWQMAIPGYAEAVATRYQDLLFNGTLMNGDVPANAINNTTQPGYSFFAGDITKLVVARKHNTSSKYAITGTIQPNSNFVGNAPLTGTASINLDGQNLKFNIRRQGSTYIYDKSNALAPVFYQLDGWHENTHPSYWSKDFVFEGELYDNTTSTTNDIKTYVPAGTIAGDYTNFTSCVGFKSVGAVEYNFVTRGTANTTHYFWIKARSKNGSNTGFSVAMDGVTKGNINCIADTNWVWYRYDGTTSLIINFANLSVGNHLLSILPTNTNLEIDLITVTSNSGLTLSPAAAPCTAAIFTPTITPSGPITFCQGGNVTLTATPGISYLWSNGATTQSIVATTTGSYSVTVNNNGQTGTSNNVNVTVNALPSNTITTSGTTAICQGSSLTLTAASGATYIWSTGATTQSINVTSAGNYSATITNSNGCTSVSNPVAVSIVNPTATITASGPTNICSNSSVTLTANSGTTYLWSTGATTQSINVNTAGTYTVTVTQSGGCSIASTGTAITLKASPSSIINTSGPTTFCNGNVTLTSGATNCTYLWSNGSTNSSITVSTSGSYICTATATNGCTSASNPVNVIAQSGTVTTPTISASGTTTFCAGNSVNLTATSGTSYLWSNGATTQTINVTTGGTYFVTVSQNGGCAATSAGRTIIVNPVATFTVNTNGPLSFCQGGNVTISVSSSNAQGYVWYRNNSIINNATSSSYRATTAGTYLVRVQRGNCGIFSSPYIVTIPCREGELTSTNISSYPNPFSETVNFNLELSESSAVSLRLYTLTGQLIEEILTDSYLSAGESTIQYNSVHLNNGIYIAEIQTSSETKRIKICKQH